MSVMLQNAVLGLIIIFLAIIILSVVTDPTSAKALLKIFLPIILVMFILSIIVEMSGGVTFDLAILMTLIFFAMFIMIGAFMGGAELKSLFVLAPLIIIPTLFAFLTDPTGKLAIIVGSSLSFGFLMLTWYLVREIGPPKQIDIPIRVGIAIENISPHGRVKLGSEVWRAFSMNWRISKGERVYVVSRKDLEVLVVPVVECPSCGEIYPVTKVPHNCKICGYDLTLKTLEVIREHTGGGHSGG